MFDLFVEREENKFGMNNGSPFVSVVIPTFNRISQLKRCLRNIFRLDYPQNCLEVIVVDNGSRDGTQAYLQELQVQRENFKWLRCEKRGRPAAANIGLRHAKGKLIFSTDDDALVDPDWINAHLAEYRDETVAVVGGWEHIIIDNLLAIFVSSRYVDEFANRIVIEGDAGWNGQAISSMNVSFRREVFDRTGFFDEHFINGADYDLTSRILRNQFKIVKNPLIRVTHLKNDTMASFIRTHWKRGLGVILYQIKHDQLPFREFIIVLTPKMIREDLQRYRKLTGIDRLGFSKAVKLVGLSILSYYVTHVSRLYHYCKIHHRLSKDRPA
ncbi:MAG: glycosyltransferase [Desulfobacterales bacterium]|nr:MAG: glycosyltransferase [Desulfobacterales bacterium]